MKTVSVLEMKELDRHTIEDIRVPSIVLMENAGRCVAEATLDVLGDREGKKVNIFCGIGNNGGDGFVAARYLANKGINVTVYIIGGTSRIKNDPKVNLNILTNLKIPIKNITTYPYEECDIIIDAIFGIGVKGEVKEPYKNIIIGINNSNKPVISVDVPSGLDADNGRVLGEAVKATKTVTMQFSKKGFYIENDPLYTGEIIVADIGIIN